MEGEFGPGDAATTVISREVSVHQHGGYSQLVGDRTSLGPYEC